MPDLTEKQVNGVAWLLHELRPEWGVGALKTLLMKNRAVPSLGALMIAATTKALEPSCATPGPIFLPGAHWPDPAAAERHLPKPPPCADHDTFAAHNCPCCWADVKIGERPQTHIGKHWQPESDREMAAQLQAMTEPTESETET